MAAGVALITGGGGGLGRAVGERLAQEGLIPLLCGRGRAALEAAAAACGGRTQVLDVTSRASCAQAVAKARRLGPLCVLVNAAGIAESAPLLPPDDDLWERSLAVNATGAWHMATAALEDLRGSGRGAIVNVASTAALRGYRYVAAYVASKHALLGLSRALAADLAGKGVRVNTVCPGFLDTPMTTRSVQRLVEKAGMDPAAARETLAAQNASGRLIPPAEVADVIARLACDTTAHGEEVLLE